MTLEREEYVEQAYFFRVWSERFAENTPLQDLLEQLQHELLATTKLPMAVSFLLAELKHSGTLGPAMLRLGHYFTPFQTYILQEAEHEGGRFDMRVAVDVLRRDAEYRAQNPSRAGAFLYQFETLCRNRLHYDRGLLAMSNDPIFDGAWREWILLVRQQIGLVDLADLVYLRSQHFWTRRAARGQTVNPEQPVLFGEKEGKIALANRRKDPLYLFAALQRHLGYPAVPRPKKPDETPQLIPQLMRRMERLEVRIKLLEDEQRGGIDLTRFYGTPPSPNDESP